MQKRLAFVLMVFFGGLGLTLGNVSCSSDSADSCTDECPTNMDMECDDGGPDSLFDICDLGTDCTDCGPR